jgi:hypothetical protein
VDKDNLGPIGAGILIILLFIFGFVIKMLWNDVMVDVFNLKAITYWQALELYLLGSILVKGVTTK